MKKIIITFLISLLLTLNVSAGADGENSLSKKNSSSSNDCFEGLNRATFAFNRGLDKVILKPVSKAYRALPTPLKNGTNNIVTNLSNLTTIPNNLLQGQFVVAGTNTLRLILNSTLGVLGIFDVASAVGFSEYKKEDYGQTLGAWGLGEGCYLMLPILGPSNVRDFTGSLASLLGGDPWYNITVRQDTSHVTDFDYYASRGASAVDFRAKNIESFDNVEKNSMDFYASVKSLYLQDRQKKISNSSAITDTMDDSDWNEIETK